MDESPEMQAKALRLVLNFEQALAVQLADEIVRYEEDFESAKDPLHGAAAALLEKYYSALNAVFVAKRQLQGK